MKNLVLYNEQFSTRVDILTTKNSILYVVATLDILNFEYLI